MNPFLIIPAIDLKDGRCVRLRQGRADAETVYSDSPVEVAQRLAAEGAAGLHVVDLDGAFQGQPVHGELIGRIASAAGVPVEVGGGIRTDEHIRAALERGVVRVILGTRALAHPEELARLVGVFGDRLAVGIDARGGKVQIKGWVETTGTDAVNLARYVSNCGVSTIIYTDTATDGMLAGPNLSAVAAVCDRVACGVIASGGVSSVADVAGLRGLNRPNLVGAIVGKALYEGRVTVPSLNAAAVAPMGDAEHGSRPVGR